MLTYTLQRFHEAIAAACPIRGVGGNEGNVTIDYDPAATQTERDNAQAVVIGFDWSNSATETWLASKNPDKKNLLDAAANAIQGNNDYLAIDSPTNAQAIAQVKRLTQQNNRLIKRLVQIQ